MIEKITTGNIEKEKKDRARIVLDFVRHGKSPYLEDFSEFSEKKPGDRSADLTKEGEEQAAKIAEEILQKIDPENDMVVMWGSPSQRAQDTEKIIIDTLTKNGIKIHKDINSGQLRNFDIKDESFKKELWERFTESGKNPEHVYSRDLNSDEFNEQIETQNDVRVRINRFINWIDYLNKNKKDEGKRLYIISASHSEVINPLVEDLFGEDESVKNCEDFSLEFDTDKQNGETKVSANYRNSRIENIRFDKEKRKFVKD